jgi:biopolymer transport protein ExbD
MSHGSSDKCEPNFTPLLDLVLQLVMFFMLCANFVLDQTDVDIKLPKAIAASVLGKSEDYPPIYLNVNKQGDVVLAPSDRYKDSAGNETALLQNPVTVLTFLKRRANEDRDAQIYKNPELKSKKREELPLRSAVILRVDSSCPFEKTYAIMKACRQAGYLRVQLRAERYSGAE